jgi:hypothetical protein
VYSPAPGGAPGGGGRAVRAAGGGRGAGVSPPLASRLGPSRVSAGDALLYRRPILRPLGRPVAAGPRSGGVRAWRPVLLRGLCRVRPSRPPPARALGRLDLPARHPGARSP